MSSDFVRNEFPKYLIAGAIAGLSVWFTVGDIKADVDRHNVNELQWVSVKDQITAFFDKGIDEFARKSDLEVIDAKLSGLATQGDVHNLALEVGELKGVIAATQRERGPYGPQGYLKGAQPARRANAR